MMLLLSDLLLKWHLSVRYFFYVWGDEEKVIYHYATLHNVACPCIILYSTKILISTPAGGARNEMLKLLWTDFSVCKKKKKIHFYFSPRAATWVYVERFRDKYGCNSNNRNLCILGKLDSFEWSLMLRCSKCVKDLWWMHMEKNSPAVNKNLPITIYLHPHFCEKKSLISEKWSPKEIITRPSIHWMHEDLSLTI